jgi:protein TonB
MTARTSSAPRPAFDPSQYAEPKNRNRWKTLPATIASVLFHAGLIALAITFVREAPRVGPASGPLVVTLGSGSGSTPEASSGKSATPVAAAPASPIVSAKPAKHPRERHRELLPKTDSEAVAAAPASPPSELSATAASAGSHDEKSSASSSAEGAGGSVANSSSGAGSGVGAGGNPAVGIDQVEHPPAVVSSVTPVYPQLARRRGIEGVVVLKFVVNQIGAVENEIQIVDSVPVLDDAAIDALRRWRFSPGRDRDGNPVRVLLEIPIRFTLR